MTGLVKTLIALIGVLWLGIAGAAGMWWWDRRPAHTPSIRLLFFTWAAPDSLGARLKTSTVRLQTSERNVATLDTAIAGQNARIQSQSDAGRAALARSAATIRGQRAAMERAFAARSALARPPAGSTRCERAQSVDDAFLAALN